MTAPVTVAAVPAFPPTRRSDHAARWSLGVALVLMGLIAGFFYAYSCSVMVGLAQVEDRTFVATMQSINATVRNAGFAPTFFGSLLVTVLATGCVYRAGWAGRHWVLAAAVLYLAAFTITMGISVPLNDRLAAAGLGDPAAARAAFEAPWVLWNLVRTGAATLALGALTIAALSRRR